MKTYLRFTPKEYEFIARVCRPIDLTDDFFPIFKYFLVESLKGVCPDLGARIARFRKHEVGIVYEHLRAERKAAGAKRQPSPRPEAVPEPDLTAEEWVAVAHASRIFSLPEKFLHTFQEFLVQHFRRSLPELSRKLARFSERQMERLYTSLRTSRHT